MGQIISLFQSSKKSFSKTEEPTERCPSSLSLFQSSKKSFSKTEEPTERCPSSLSCGSSVLDLDNNLFICNLVKDDPNGYSSRVYYRSGLGTGVPFTWEAEPGKPKTNTMEESDFIVVPPPPSFEGDKKLTLLQVRNRETGTKSCRFRRATVGCIPFPKNLCSYSS